MTFKKGDRVTVLRSEWFLDAAALNEDLSSDAVYLRAPWEGVVIGMTADLYDVVPLAYPDSPPGGFVAKALRLSALSVLSGEAFDDVQEG